MATDAIVLLSSDSDVPESPTRNTRPRETVERVSQGVEGQETGRDGASRFLAPARNRSSRFGLDLSDELEPFPSSPFLQTTRRTDGRTAALRPDRQVQEVVSVTEIVSSEADNIVDDDGGGGGGDGGSNDDDEDQTATWSKRPLEYAELDSTRPVKRARLIPERESPVPSPQPAASAVLPTPTEALRKRDRVERDWFLSSSPLLSKPLPKQVVQASSWQEGTESAWPRETGTRVSTVDGTMGVTAEAIDLLSSSDSEPDRTVSTVASTFAPSSKESHSAEDCDPGLGSRASLPAGTAAKPTLETGRERDNVLLLSSSSPVALGEVSSRVSDRSLDAHTRVPPKPAQRRLHQRSVSEGHQHFCFSDGDDSDIDGDDDDNAKESSNQPDFVEIDKLLASWRGGGQGQDGRHTLRQRSSSPVMQRSVTDDEWEREIGAALARTGPQRASRPSLPAHGVNKASRASRASRDGENKETRRQDREAEREQKRREKEAEKERKREERQVERERRRVAVALAKEKKAEERVAESAYNEANRWQGDKSKEMIVRIPSTLPLATREVLEPMLAETEAESELWTSPLECCSVVVWRRKVTSEYDADQGRWKPVPLCIRDEKHALVIMRADKFVQLLLAEDPEGRRRTDDLGGHVRMMRQHFPGHRILYMVEGLKAWRSQHHSARNRHFTEAVRDRGDATATSGDGGQRGGRGGRGGRGRGGRGRGRGGAGHARAESSGQVVPTASTSTTTPPRQVDAAALEAGLLALHVEHKVLVHESTDALDTAQWIVSFTEQIAKGRYRLSREEDLMATASFCMDAGQIAKGDGAEETYLLMLQQIAQLTEPVALGVASRFESMPKLLEKLKAEGPLALEACLRSRDRHGAPSEQTVGPALSRRVYEVFMGQDEHSKIS